MTDGNCAPLHRQVLWRRAGFDEGAGASRVLIAGDVLPTPPLSADDEAGWRALVVGLTPLLDGVDVAIANLECPLTEEGAPRPKLGGSSFRAPPGATAFLEAMRLRVVSIANNHIYDFGEGGLRDTRLHLQSARILAIGAEVAPDDPPPVAILPLSAGGSVGFYAACFDLPETAGRRPRGLEPIRIERARAAVDRLAEGGASVRIALLHLGLEGQDHPEPADVQKMREVAAAGFDVVAACHAHRLQGAESRNPKGSPSFIFYGLGSLASSCIYGERERDGLVVLLGLDDAGRLGSVEVAPVRLADDGRPSAPPAEQAQAILARFDVLSRALEDGTYRKAFYEASSRGLWRAQAAEMVRVFKRGGTRGLLVKLRQLRWKHLERAWYALAGRLARPRKS